MSRCMQLHYISVTAFSSTDLFLDRIYFEWDSRGSAITNHKTLIDVTGPELLFFHKRKGVLKIDQSVKILWHRLSMGVASSCSSAPAFISPGPLNRWSSYPSSRDVISFLSCDGFVVTGCTIWGRSWEAFQLNRESHNPLAFILSVSDSNISLNFLRTHKMLFDW